MKEYLHRLVSDDEVEEYDAGVSHQPGLNKDDDEDAGKEEIDEAVILVRESKDGPVPENIKEEQQHSECIIDSAATVGGYVQGLIATLAGISEFQAF